jgi:hypothetical protein
MRKIVLLAVLTAFVTAGGAGAAGSGPSASGHAHVLAHDVFGLQTLELKRFNFHAKVEKAGDVRGHFNYLEIDDGTPYSAKGPLTCLTVIGGDAWLGGPIERSNDPSLEGQWGWWHVRDNGEGKNAPPDLTSFMGVGSLAETEAFCNNHPAFRFPFPIDRGNTPVRG